MPGDPPTTLSASLKERGLATDTLIAAIDISVSDEVNLAGNFAESGTWEPVKDLLKDVYTPPEPDAARIDGAT